MLGKLCPALGRPPSKKKGKKIESRKQGGRKNCKPTVN